LSYYPWWHGSFSDFRTNINDLAVRYNKDIVVVETAYPWTTQYVNDGIPNVGFDPTKLPVGYPVNPQGQSDFLTYLSILIRALQTIGGSGSYIGNLRIFQSPLLVLHGKIIVYLILMVTRSIPCKYFRIPIV